MSAASSGHAPEWVAAQQVRARIAAACARAGRNPDEVTLVAAAKTVPPERILASGVRDVGENRVQDMLAKAEVLDGHGIRWHFIGPLQRNKAGKVVGRAAVIHSLDSVPLGRAIARKAEALGITQDVLVEVNLSKESSKTGVPEENLDEFLEELRIPGLAVRGLMSVPAPGAAETSRAAFRRLAALVRDRGLEHCSMGMSADFEIAVEEGATIVRVGTAIFGERPPGWER